MFIKKLLFITFIYAAGNHILAADANKVGDIIALVGTSTAGKTSIIKALKHLESDRLEDGVDLRTMAIGLGIINKFYPLEIAILNRVLNEPIAKAVFSSKRSWKSGASFEEQEQAENAIKTIQEAISDPSPELAETFNFSFKDLEFEMFDDAVACSRRGQNVIFDVLDFSTLSNYINDKNINEPIRVILVYCPFHELSARMEKRNKEAVESGDTDNQRIGAFPLEQFSRIYTQKKDYQNTFELVKREQAIKAFSENFDNGIENARRQRCEEEKLERMSLDKEQKLTKFLENLGFIDGVDEVEIAPKNQEFYHLFIDSNKLLPEQAAEIIHKGTYQRK